MNIKLTYELDLDDGKLSAEEWTCLALPEKLACKHGKPAADPLDGSAHKARNPGAPAVPSLPPARGRTPEAAGWERVPS